MPALTDDVRRAVREQLTARPSPPKHNNKQRRVGAGLWCRPHASDALGCQVEEIEENRQFLRAHGIAADFDKEGRVLITSEKQRREICKAYGLWDGAKGYGQRDEEGRMVRHGREQQRSREEFRRKLDRGEIAFD